MPWPNPALTGEESATLAAVMNADTANAATLLETTPSQAAALQRYIVMVCVLNQRKRRGIPFEPLQKQAHALLRCMAPAMRNRLPDALRYGT